MNTFIALFRGINVGGNHILPMKELAALMEGLGLSNIRTYIQSGNVVFQSKAGNINEIANDISAAIGKSFGFVPQVLILSQQELGKAIASNPFPEGQSEPKSLHFLFLESVPGNPDMDKLETIKMASERFRLVDSVFYLHAPEGIGRSKLAANVEKALGVSGTARNWRSVNKIMSMALELRAG